MNTCYRKKKFKSVILLDDRFVLWMLNILIMVNIGLGTVIFIGGESRFPLPSYKPLLDYTGDRPWIWAVWICLSAFLMATPFKWLNVAGLWLSMFWHFIWMFAFTVAAVHNSDAAGTPIPVYGGMALVSAALLTVRVIAKKEE